MQPTDALTVEDVDTIDAVPEATSSSRLAGFGVLVASLAFVACAGHEVYRAFSDAWAAPFSLTPETDAVLQFRTRMIDERVQLDRLRQETSRAAARLDAVRRIRTRVARLREELSSLRSYRSDESRSDVATSAEQLRLLREEERMLTQVVSDLEGDVESAVRSREAGLIDNADVELRRRSLGDARLRLAALQREMRASLRLTELAGARARSLGAEGSSLVVPESFEQSERVLRLELEDLELEAEEGLLASSLATWRERIVESERLLASLAEKPQVQAQTRRVDLLFVPYEHLARVSRGDGVMLCAGGVAFCRKVGSVVRVIPGEVMTDGPFGDRERGQYAEVQLHDDDARRASTLRVRR